MNEMIYGEPFSEQQYKQWAFYNPLVSLIPPNALEF